MKKSGITRREFIVRAAASSAAFMLAPFLLAGSDSKKSGGSKNNDALKTTTFDLNDPAYAPLKNEGGAVYAKIDGYRDQVIIHRVSDSEAAVFSSRCTHAGCKVELPNNGKAVCKCHNSVFDDVGKRLSGPASKDLKRFDARIAGDSIVVSVS